LLDIFLNKNLNRRFDSLKINQTSTKMSIINNDVIYGFNRTEHLLILTNHSKLARNCLTTLYRWIGIGSSVMKWPPRSSDLTPLDFFWGYNKKVFAKKSTIIEIISEHKNHIKQAFESIKTLQRVCVNFRYIRCSG